MNKPQHHDIEREPIDGEILLPTTISELSPAVAAEINQQVATAKRYPRRRDKEVSDEIMGRATLNEEIASECMYSLKRGDKQITGPSIRFAEIIRASFGNIRVATRFVGIDMTDPDRQAVIVEAVALDVQGNQGEVVFERRSIMTSGYGGKKPKPYGADMTAIAISAARSIARRNSILAIVPKAIWIEAYQRVVKVLQGDANTLQKRRVDVLTAFDKIGVAREAVFGAVGVKSIEDVTLEHMPQLIGFLTAIKEGETADSVLGKAQEGGADHAKVANPLKDQPTDVGEQGGDAVAETATTATEAKVEQTTTADKPVQTETKAAKVEPAKTGLDAITTLEAYKAHALGWIKAAASAQAVKDQWRAEREKRKVLGVMESDLAELQRAVNDRVAALAPKD